MLLRQSLTIFPEYLAHHLLWAIKCAYTSTSMLMDREVSLWQSVFKEGSVLQLWQGNVVLTMTLAVCLCFWHEFEPLQCSLLGPANGEPVRVVSNWHDRWSSLVSFPAEGVKHGLSVVLVADNIDDRIDKSRTPVDDVASNVESWQIIVRRHGMECQHQSWWHEADNIAGTNQQASLGDVLLPLPQLPADIVDIVGIQSSVSADIKGLSHLVSQGSDPLVN